MKIEIKLKDVNYCDGCPCIGWTDIGGDLWCMVEGGMDEPEGNYRPEDERLIRPQQCKDKYGE